MGDNYKVELEAQVKEGSIQASIDKQEPQLKPINLKFQMRTEDFQVKLNNLRTTGGLTKKQFAEFNNELAILRTRLNSGSITADDFNASMHKLKNEVSEASTVTKAHGQSITDIIKKFTQWITVSTLVMQTINTLKKMVSEVMDIDRALLEVSKVSDLTADQLEVVKNKAFEVGREIGRTGTEVLDAVATFKRAGYTIAESFDLAETALVMTNVADGIDDVTAASSSLIAILRGFKMDASEANRVLDVLNHTSNNFAVDAVNLTDIMERVSGTIAQTGTSFEELTGLATAAFGTLRNAEMVASGINMISQRMRGMTDAGEEAVGLVPKIEEALQKYTGGAVSMIDKETGGLRSTYDVLQDLSKVYSTLDDSARAYLNEVIAGNRQNKVLVSIMESWQEVEEVVKEASDATGSAAEENEKYLDSIQGGIAGLKSAFQELADKTISRDFVKSIISAATNVIDFVNKIGGLKTVLLGLISIITILKAETIATFVTNMINGAKAIVMLIPKIFSLIAATKAQAAADTSAAVAAAAKNTAITMGVAAAGIAAGIATVTLAIVSATKKVDTNVDSFEDATEAYGDAKNELTEYEKSLNELRSSLESVNSKIENQISLLEKQNDKLKEEKQLKDKLLAVEKARVAFAEAKQKKIGVFRAGVGFVYEADVAEVQSAQEDLTKAIDKLAEYKFDYALDRAEEFVSQLNELLTSGDIVAGWGELFDEFGDLLDTEFASYLLDAQAFVDEFRKTVEETPEIKNTYQVEAKEGLVTGGGGGGGSWASGTRSAPGGISLVGENGPELINLPRGTEILSNPQSMKLHDIVNNPSRYVSSATNGTGSNSVVINGPINLPNVTDADGFIDAMVAIGNNSIPKFA